MKEQRKSTCMLVKCLAVMMLMILAAACGSEDDVVEDERGPTSIEVTIVGSGEVEHSLGTSPNNPCIGPGYCTWNFTSGSLVTLTATPGSGCAFGGWGLDCQTSGTNLTCPSSGSITVDRQYDVRATFTCP